MDTNKSRNVPKTSYKYNIMNLLRRFKPYEFYISKVDNQTAV